MKKWIEKIKINCVLPLTTTRYIPFFDINIATNITACGKESIKKGYDMTEKWLGNYNE